MRLIPLIDRAGVTVAHAKVDDDLYDLLAQHTWRFHRATGYVRRTVGRAAIYMHREVTGLTPGDGMRADHWNGDKLDNQRGNLRVCNASQNGQNRHAPTGGTSKHRGVYWNKTEQRWFAKATLNRRSITIGRFTTEEEAARAAAAFRAQHMPFSADARLVEREVRAQEVAA